MKDNLCEGTCDRNARVLYEQKDQIVYQVQNTDGELTITEHHVFPGIWLCYKDAHTHKFTYPPTYPEGVLEITHCREGRFEYDGGEHFFYLTKGDLSISRCQGSGTSVYCPTGHYRGISILIDPQAAHHCLSCILEDVEVDPDMLMEKFCGENQYFIVRSSPRLEHIFSELYSVPEGLQRGYFKVKILELLLFLTGLDPAQSQSKQHSCSKSQADLAKQVCQFIHEQPDARLTIGELATKFFVSPAQLKKCFYSVYGESVQAYIRAEKMRSAAYILETTGQTISETASAYGYDNSSKFSRAFREVMGVSPTEYRNGLRRTDE